MEFYNSRNIHRHKTPSAAASSALPTSNLNHNCNKNNNTLELLLNDNDIDAYIQNTMSTFERDIFMRNLYKYDREMDFYYKKIITNIFEFCYFFITMRIYPELDKYELLYDRLIAMFRESAPIRLCILTNIYCYSKNLKSDFHEIHNRMLIIHQEKLLMFKTPRCVLKGDLYLKYAELVQVDQGRWLKLIKATVLSIETLYNSGNLSLNEIGEDKQTFSCFIYVIKHIILASEEDRLYTDKHLKFSNKFITEKDLVIKVYDALVDLEFRYLYIEPEFLEYTTNNNYNNIANNYIIGGHQQQHQCATINK